jgi:hypothetical protein
MLSNDLFLAMVLISLIGNAVDKVYCSRPIGPP